MPLKFTTLPRRDDGLYEEPDGEIVRVLGKSRTGLKLITRVDEPEVEPPFDTSDCTVADIEDRVADGGYTHDELTALLDDEEANKNRTTAVDAIQEEL